MNDEEIVQKIREGDKIAFMDLVDAYKKKIIALCNSYTGDYHEAEDLSQEVFIALYRNINKFRFESSLSTYIYRISLSKCMDYKRKNRVRSFLGGIINIQRTREEDIDEKNYIRQCIKDLPENLKTPLVLYYYIGLSQKEISKVMFISEKNVEGRIYRARKRLKTEIEKEAEYLEGKIGLYR